MFNMNKVFFSKKLNDAFVLNEQFAQDIVDSLTYYALNNWGASCSEDWQKNDEALITNDQVVAKYNTYIDDIFIITDAGSEVTTVIFCTEY